MIIFKNIEIRKFRNIKNAKLNDLKDVNILIGPNNCGKTNILELISSLRELTISRPSNYLCEECTRFKERNKDIEGLYLPIGHEDFYLRKDPKKAKMVLKILFNREQIDMFVPKVLEKQKERLNKMTCQSITETIVMENIGSELYGKHFSPFIHKDIIEEIKRSILYCPEGRLQSYKEKGFVEYIRGMKLRGSQKRRWIDFLSKIVDPKIDDERYKSLIRKVDGEDFETEISKQGSGVRSLVCLAVDILFSQDKRIVLVDEPELGLNPFVKQEFLKFLIDESKGKQIFIATQDPTFVNPVVWENNNVSVYFYSVIDEQFYKIDLKQSQEDPSTFAGYLPHTVSLKDIHIYVEGTSDVYIFQIFLEKYLKENFPKNWFQVLSKVGIYHLCGDFWRHLLYTIPKHPYKCIIILDGNKLEVVEKICEKYDKSPVIASRFNFCKKIDDVGSALSKKVHPVYCLKENCIEKYIIPNFDCDNPPQDYNKRVDGPKKAEELEKIPDEIKQLLEMIFGTLGLGPKKYVFIENKIHLED
jgi:predicted ATP-dependent endonuclease of OLD family